jgi:hypothetical protein
MAKMNKHLEKLTSTKYPEQSVSKFNQTCNRSWRPIGLWYQGSTFSKQSAHRLQWGCQPYALDVPLAPEIPGTHICQRLLTQMQKWSWKNCINWKIQWSYWESSPRPFGLWPRSASTMLPRAPGNMPLKERIGQFLMVFLGYCWLIQIPDHTYLNEKFVFNKHEVIITYSKISPR